MNREIKFKVRDTELNIWIDNIGMKKNNVLTNGNEKRFHVLEYTGFRDMQNNEICEGDILYLELKTVKNNGLQDMFSEIYWTEKIEYIKYKVIYENACFWIEKIEGLIKVELHDSNLNILKIIGNIYENPIL